MDHDVATGVWPDMTEHGWDNDAWPAIQAKVWAAHILVIAGPIWLGDNSSETKKCIERLYASSSELNDNGQWRYYGRVGGCLITGNEDGIKHCASNVLYSLQHVGYTIPPQADAGWIGEAGPGPSYLDPGSGGPENEFTSRNTTFMTWNLLHLAAMLHGAGGIPAYGNQRSAWGRRPTFRLGEPGVPASLTARRGRPERGGTPRTRMSAEMPEQSKRLRGAVRVSGCSVVWSLTVGVAALFSGTVSASLALIAFGLSSIVDGSASVVLVWRFSIEGNQPERAHRVERLAERVLSITLLVVAVFLLASAVHALVAHDEPGDSAVGTVIAVASLVVLPILAVRKFKLAAAIPSRALRSDGILTTAGAVLAVVTLVALVLNETLHWWWADSVAAAAIALVLGREGLTGLRDASAP